MLFEAVAGQHRRITESSNVQELSNITWAFATAGHKAETLFESVADQHGLIVISGNVQELSNLLWAFATAGYNASVFFEAVAASSAVHERYLRDGNEQEVSE